MNFKRVIIERPQAEPVTLQQACDQLRIDVGFDDTLVNALISAAREHIENYCNQYFTQQKVKIIFYELFDRKKIELFQKEVASIESAVLFDSENQPSDIACTTNSERNELYIDTEIASNFNRIEVVFNTLAQKNIDSVNAAILILVTEMYENRSQNVTGTIVGKNPTMQMLLSPHRNNIGV